MIFKQSALSKGTYPPESLWDALPLKRPTALCIYGYPLIIPVFFSSYFGFSIQLQVHKWKPDFSSNTTIGGQQFNYQKFFQFYNLQGKQGPFTSSFSI
jgi:hypothetical protein